MSRPSPRRRSITNALFAFGAIAGVSLALAATYVSYTGAAKELVDPSVVIGIDSPRAGLVMARGALVKLNGVEVGTVADVRSTTDGARLDVRLNGAAAADIPRNIGATIAATTIFGAKYVQLTDPPTPSSDPIGAGAVVPASSVTVETNTVFESLNAVLTASQPDRLNATISGIADGLDGRGAALGRTIDDANAVLARIEPLVPTLQRDIASGTTTLGAVADATPDLLGTLVDLTTTGRTVVDRDDALGVLLDSVTDTGTVGTEVLSDNASGLSGTIHTLRPTTDLLGEYSPVLTCFLQGTDRARVSAEKVSGGNGRTMLLNSTVLFGVPPYTYADDLPKVAASGGPRCGALPFLTEADSPAPYVVADTGSNPFRAGNTGPVLSPTSIIDFLPGGLAAPRTTR